MNYFESARRLEIRTWAVLIFAATVAFLGGVTTPAQTFSPSAGELDATFDQDGKVVTGFAMNSNDQIFGMALQPDLVCFEQHDGDDFLS